MKIEYLICLAVALALSLILYLPISFILAKFKARQTTLHYVEKHAGKSGTQTMGGIIFIIASILAAFWFFKGDTTGAWLCLVVMVAYGVLGFLDDFVKVKFKQNGGLLPYQKIIGQVGISLLIAMYIYFKVGTSLNFFNLELNIGFFIIPLVIIVFLATTNSVNLIDGLDGLASSVCFVFLFFFALILMLLQGFENYIILCFSMLGALLGFKVFNTYPAKIFMGDCGSMALGGFIACLTCLTGTELLLPIIGMMFVITSLSDIIQVAYFKKTKKRVFLMAPLHHHFEKKGVHENRIVAIYLIVTVFMGLGCLMLYI